MIDKFQIQSFVSLSKDTLFRDIVQNVTKDNKSFDVIFAQTFDLGYISKEIGENISRYPFDDRYKLFSVYLKNHFQFVFKQKNKINITSYIENLFLALYIEDFINFTKIKNKMLEMTNLYLQVYPNIFTKTEYYEELFNNSHMNSYNLFNVIFEEFVALLKKLNESPEEIERPKKIKLASSNICENSTQIWSQQSVDKFNTKKNKDSNFNLDVKGKSDEPSKSWYGYKISLIDQVDRFEIFDQEEIVKIKNQKENYLQYDTQ